MSNCSNTQIGVTPLNDLGTGLYLSKYKGGLYRDGLNVTPTIHLNRGISVASHIAPINGKVTMGTLGNSVTSMISDYVISQAASDVALSPDLQIVNLAHGGMDIKKVSDPFGIYWETHIPAALVAASITWEDIQVLWIQTNDRADDDPAPAAFPVSSWNRVIEWKKILHNALYFFPNLKMAFLTSPGYMGYWDQPGPQMEPNNYENAFSVRDVIDRQITGDPELNFDPAQGVVRAPWIDWGFYPWCDGINARASDGLTWLCPDDVQNEGQHPSPTGRAKMAARILTYHKAHTACASWFLA